VSEFLAEVRRSTERLRLAEPDEKARLFEVVIDASGRAGRLLVESGVKGERAVTGVDCAEVSRVLAFAVALAADPDAHAPDVVSNVAAFPEAAPPPAVATLGEAPATERPARSKQKREPAPAQRLRSNTPMSASFGALYLVKSASAPGLTMHGGAIAELGFGRVPLAPRVRLGGGFGGKQVTAEQGHVSFSEYFVSLESCAAFRKSTLTLLPCLRALGGLRTSTGHGVPQARGATRPYLELGFASHLRWRFSGGLFAELGGGALFPTIRDRVLIVPEPTVYRVPAVAGVAEFVLGFEFADQKRN
jgi:hypothetical protein